MWFPIASIIILTFFSIGSAILSYLQDKLLSSVTEHYEAVSKNSENLIKEYNKLQEENEHLNKELKEKQTALEVALSVKTTKKAATKKATTKKTEAKKTTTKKTTKKEVK